MTCEVDLNVLPPGQRGAMEALIGGGVDARTYIEAADMAGMSVGTIKTHVRWTPSLGQE